METIAGINSILEALKGNRRRVKKIFIQEGRQGKRVEELARYAQKKGVFIQFVEKQRLDKMYTVANHQGVIAWVDDYKYSQLQDILDLASLRQEKPFILILDGIEDPQNLGSIIRSAESAGVHGIIIPRHGSAEVTGAVVKASAGAVEHVLLARETNLVSVIQRLKESGVWIIGADMKGVTDYFKTSLPESIALVIGGEGRGIRRLVKEHCDFLVRIPMKGRIESLNASVAAALLLYEVVRQRAVK
ncbi:MAG: 23S rRNA (guanosine(2251)-2'-O)-methyltransferase RlmB [Syntrophomonadaceae bacterium]|jgi:23S rRNA (guanosine2251-2'-O)-methyltransferase